jgi:AraC-like DNA-binding protein
MDRRDMGLSASVEYLNLAMNYALQLGLDPDQIYRKAGFDASILKTPGARIPVDQFSAVWDAFEEVNPDADLGLHLGETTFNFPGHILFLLMLNAPTIKDAMDKFCGYFNLLTDFTSPCFSIHDGFAILSIRFHATEFQPSRHANECILAAYASVLNRISENRVRFESIYFVHSRPENISEHNRIFRAPIFFDQPENKLVFKNKYLDLPVLLSNEEVLNNLEFLARKLQERIYTAGPWSEKVTRIIMNIIKGEKPEIETIARKLAVSSRNLQNRLKEEGVTYQKLLDNVRKEQAIYFLENENIPISEIGLLLGYSEQSVFSRAFKRWVGTTPGQYRSRLK